MQLIRAEILPIVLKLKQTMRMASIPEIKEIDAIIVRLDLKDGRSAWGSCVVHPDLTGEKPEDVLRACQNCASMAPDLHPTNLEYSLAQIEKVAHGVRGAETAFDLAIHDLLGLATGLPLYRLLGGYRDRIQTSVTIPISNPIDSVEMALGRAVEGFRMLKIKGGLDPDEDVKRVRAIRSAVPGMILRLDADGGYDVKVALDVANALKDDLEMIEQPTTIDDLDALLEVRKNCPIPVLADQCVRGPASALKIAADHKADGISVKLATCGGFRGARLIDGIARAAGLNLMVSCLVEPALLISAGLSYALCSPAVKYADLDGHLDLINDPTIPGFELEDGWLIAGEIPGLGCRMDL